MAITRPTSTPPRQPVYQVQSFIVPVLAGKPRSVGVGAHIAAESTSKNPSDRQSIVRVVAGYLALAAGPPDSDADETRILRAYLDEAPALKLARLEGPAIAIGDVMVSARSLAKGASRLAPLAPTDDRPIPEGRAAFSFTPPKSVSTLRIHVRDSATIEAGAWRIISAGPEREIEHPIDLNEENVRVVLFDPAVGPAIALELLGGAGPAPTALTYRLLRGRDLPDWIAALPAASDWEGRSQTIRLHGGWNRIDLHSGLTDFVAIEIAAPEEEGGDAKAWTPPLAARWVLRREARPATFVSLDPIRKTSLAVAEPFAGTGGDRLATAIDMAASGGETVYVASRNCVALALAQPAIFRAPNLAVIDLGDPIESGLTPDKAIVALDRSSGGFTRIMTAREVDAKMLEEAGLKGRAIPSQRRMLVAAHDFRFVRDVEAALGRDGIMVHRQSWQSHAKSAEGGEAAIWSEADTILCEWRLGNAVWWSNHIDADQRPVVRYHSREYLTAFPAAVDFARVDAVVFVSPFVMREAQKRFGIPAHKCRVIPNAAEMPETTP